MICTPELWSEALARLQVRVPAETFAARLQDAHFITHHNGTVVIGVPDETSQRWLADRLASQVVQTLAALLDAPVAVEFVVAAPATESPPDKPHYNEATLSEQREADPLPNAMKTDFYTAFFGSRGAGYAQVSHYASQFWQPYLGGAYLLWKRLDADARDSPKNVAARWSQPRTTSYTKLMTMLNLKHTRCISGAMMECWQSRDAIRETGASLPACCGRCGDVRTKHDRDGRPRCTHWYVGMLETLARQGLVAVELERGAHPRSYTLRLQVWRLLPILTPAQVAHLNSDLQGEHERWLIDFGKHVNVGSVADWQRIREPTLVPLLEGYADYRQVPPDRYHPRAKFLKLLPGFPA